MDTCVRFCTDPSHTAETCPLRGYRLLLAQGPPPESECCAQHAKIGKQAATGHNNASEISTTLYASKLLQETFTSETALFPICRPCLKDELGLVGRQKLPKVDRCECAFHILAKQCWYCAVDAIQTKKLDAIIDRTIKTPLSGDKIRLELLCKCGDFVESPERARQCVGCGGIVTKPFCNFAGSKVEFHFATMNIEGPKEAAKDASRVG